jgi:dihydroneopterin aldolase
MSTTDKLFIKGFKIKTYIGIYEWERRVLQTVLIDVDLYLDLEKLAQEDNVDSTLNYKIVVDRIKDFIKQNAPFNIVEVLAKQIAELIKSEFPLVDRIRLSVSKPSVFSDIAAVGVCIER